MLKEIAFEISHFCTFQADRCTYVRTDGWTNIKLY